jgi:hypothetical protein
MRIEKENKRKNIGGYYIQRRLRLRCRVSMISIG